MAISIADNIKQYQINKHSIIKQNDAVEIASECKETFNLSCLRIFLLNDGIQSVPKLISSLRKGEWYGEYNKQKLFNVVSNRSPW